MWTSCYWVGEPLVVLPAKAEGEMSRESALIAVTALVEQMSAAEEKLRLRKTAIITATKPDKEK